MKRLVYFGSAFNPPHTGHLLCMAWLLQRPNVDLVLAGPSKVHAFAKDMADYDARCAMTQDMLVQAGSPANLHVSRIEQDMANAATDPTAPIYTYDVLVALRERYPTHRIVFGLGPDNIEHFHRFYRYQDILSAFELEECPLMGEVRSTDIRRAAKEGDRAFIERHTAAAIVSRVLELYK